MSNPINGKRQPIPEGLRKMIGQAKQIPGAREQHQQPLEVGITGSAEHGLVIMDFSVPIKFIGWRKNEALEIAANLIAVAEALPDEPAEEVPPAGAVPANDTEPPPG